MSEQNSKINWVSVFFLCAYPILIVLAAILYIVFLGITWTDVALIAVAYYGANLSVGLGFHRLWSHGAYKTHKFVEIILAFVTAGTFQGPVLAWASDHRRHHAHTDKELDPHSPSRYKNKFMGFLWSHMGWMLTGKPSYENLDPVTMKKLGDNKVLRWQFDNYFMIATYMNLFLPATIGFVIFGNLQGTLASLIFMGLGRVLQQQMTFCVNSICHIFGSKKYYDGSARDVWWLFAFLLGENWHNFHHAFARDYRNGVRWYQLDVHKWIIALMEKCGLAWDLVRTSEQRISAKISENTISMKNDGMNKLMRVREYSLLIAKEAGQRLDNLDLTILKSELSKRRIKKTLMRLERSSFLLANQAREWVDAKSASYDRLSNKALKKFEAIKAQAQDLGISIQLPAYQ